MHSMVSASGTAPRQCKRYRSRYSVFSRLSEASQLSKIRRPPAFCGSTLETSR